MRCAERENLRDAAARCEQARVRFAGSSDDHVRARQILALMAKHCTDAAAVFDIDPTLTTEPYGTGRFRAVDLLAELARMIKPRLAHACSDQFLDRQPRQDRWDEVDAIAARAEKLAAIVVDVVPRRDHDTEDGSRRISRARLAAQSRVLADAAAEVRAVCGGAQLGLPHVDGTVGDLTTLAAQLEQIAAALDAEHERYVAALSTAVGLSA